VKLLIAQAEHLSENFLQSLALLVLIVVAVGFLAPGLYRWVLRGLDRRSPLAATPATRKLLATGLAWLTAAGAGSAYLSRTDLSEMNHHLLARGTWIVAMAAGIVSVFGLWDMVCDTLMARNTSSERAEKLLVPVTRKLVRMVIFTAGILVMLGIFGVNVEGLIAGLGIGGLVVALAAKDSVENIFGSMTILFDMPFALGDWIKIDKIEGVVEEINLRSTRIRTFDDTVITLPNANLIRASVENFGARRSRRQKFSVPVQPTSGPSELRAYCEAVRERMETMDVVQKGRSIVEVTDITDASVAIFVQTYFEVDSLAGELRAKNDVLMAMLELAMEHGLKISGTLVAAIQSSSPKLPTG